MRWIFVVAGIVCAVIATIIAISLPDLMRQGNEIKELQQKINNTDFFKPAQFSIKIAYGLAGSLDNLQNQSIAELNYTNELHGYIKSHNITCCLNFDEMEDYELEPIVKRQMQECQSGRHDYMVNYTKNMTSGSPSLKDTEKEILGSYGDC